MNAKRPARHMPVSQRQLDATRAQIERARAEGNVPLQLASERILARFEARYAEQQTARAARAAR